jgi:hypothetical protein
VRAAFYPFQGGGFRLSSLAAQNQRILRLPPRAARRNCRGFDSLPDAELGILQ